MKKSLSLLIIAIIALTSSINANAWTDRNTFNLKGPVKTVYDNYGNTILEFEENGDIIFEEDPNLYWGTIERDNKGRINYMTMDGYTYNSKGQVIETNHLGGGAEYTIKHTYNTKGHIIKEITDGTEGNYTTTYTYQKFDKHGNWIKRTAKNKYGKEVQTRTITYYE